MGRSILAIVAGVATITVLAIGGDAVMERVMPSAFDANGFSDKIPVLLAMLVYMSVFAGVGGWVAALVTRAGLRDVWILAGLQFAMTLAANVMLFDRRLLWFYGVGLVLMPVAILVGGRVRTRRPGAQASEHLVAAPQ